MGRLLAAESPTAEGGSASDEADKLAKQLANPIASLISVPFQANEDFGYGPSHNGYKFTLDIQPGHSHFTTVGPMENVPVLKSNVALKCYRRAL